MEFDYRTPIWMQVAEAIKQDVAVGEIAPGARLPSVADIALRYGINPNTAQRVYKGLESEGILFIRRGIGAFVTEDAGLRARLRRALVAELKSQYLSGMKRLGYDRAEAVRLMDETGEEKHADV